MATWRERFRPLIATVIKAHTGEFVMIEFGDGTTGCWHCGELEILGEGE